MISYSPRLSSSPGHPTSSLLLIFIYTVFCIYVQGPSFFMFFSVSGWHSKCLLGRFPWYLCCTCPTPWHLLATIQCPFLFPLFRPIGFILQLPPFDLGLCFHSLLSRSEINPTHYHSMSCSYIISSYPLTTSSLFQTGLPAKETVASCGPSSTLVHYSVFFLLLEIGFHETRFHSFSKIHHHLSFNIPSSYTTSAYHLFIS